VIRAALDTEAAPFLADDAMCTTTLAELHLAYLARVTEEEPEHELSWTFEAVDDLVRHHPAIALKLLLTCIARACAARDIGLIAAGPIEDRIAVHGPAVIDRIEHQAKTSTRLRYTFSGAWPQGQAETAICARILRARAAGPDMDKDDTPF